MPMKVSQRRWKSAQWAEWKWWRHYLKKKSPEEYLQWKTQYWGQFISALPSPVPDHPETKIFDAGCGPAGISLHFHQAQITAVDPLLEQYQKLPHFFPDSHPNTRFIVSRLEEFRTEEEFDYIFCINVINHVQDIPKVLNLFYNSLKERGWLVLSSDVHHSPLFRKVLGLVPADILHPHQYLEKEYRALIEAAGFELNESRVLKKGRIFDYTLYVAKK